MAATAKEQKSRKDKFSNAAKNAVSEQNKQPVVDHEITEVPAEPAKEEVSLAGEKEIKTPQKKSEEKLKKKKKTAGRPAGEPTYKINLAIPEALKGDIDAAALMYKGSVTGYINALIKKDLEENGKKYREFKLMLEE